MRTPCITWKLNKRVVPAHLDVQVIVSLFALIASALREAAPAGSRRQIDFLRDATAADDRSTVAALVSKLFEDMARVLGRRASRDEIGTVVSVGGAMVWLRKQGLDKYSPENIQGFFDAMKKCNGTWWDKLKATVVAIVAADGAAPFIPIPAPSGG